MNREGKKCVLYPRVSTEMQVDGYSLEGQKNGLKRFADREEMEIVGIYEDANANISIPYYLFRESKIFKKTIIICNAF